jgi:hypothetical protein
MSEPAPSTAPPIPRRKTAGLLPTFFGAWRGIWLLTWRSLLTWRRLPLTLGLLAALPVLVYLTTVSPEGWAQHQRRMLLGVPWESARALSRQMDRAHRPIRREQRPLVLRIFSEEFARAQSVGAQTPSGEPDAATLQAQIQACYDRIQTRLQTILNEEQMTEFRTYRKREVALRQERASEPQWGRSAPFYHWLIDLYFFVILPLNCVRASGALIRDELQADTLGYLLTRPLSRARLLILKYLAQTVWLQVALLLETLLLFGTGRLRQMPDLGPLLPLLLAAQLLAVPAWSALGLLLGQITNRYMAVAIVYGLIVEMGIGSIPTNINTLSLVRHLKTLLSHHAPLQAIYQWTAIGVPLAVTALVLAPTLFLAAAALLFNCREYHHPTEMQK